MKRFFSILLVVVICFSFGGCGHKHTLKEEVLTRATCLSEGTVRKYCTECEYSYEETIPSGTHTFDKENVIIPATCTKDGTTVYTCSVCGETKKETVPAQHDFVDNVCTKCDVVVATNIEADTWYTYKSLDILKVQNALVDLATATRTGVTVKYYAVCKDCHLVDDMPGMAAPEINYSVKKNYICDYCGSVTIVKFEITS